MGRILVPLALLLLLPPAGCGAERRPTVRLATTTSTHNSGLLGFLLPPFEEATGIEVQVLAVGTGQALELGRRGDADLLLVHAREREDAFVAEGHGSERRDVMWNDFVLAGPRADPAGVRGLRDAAAALARIAARGARFVSRGDDSGTHIRERALWKLVGGAPEREPFYLSAGQGMGNCLVMADEKRAYVLTDRGTLLAFAGRVDLDVLVEGDARLRNPYGALLVNPERHPRVRADAARRLFDYLVSDEGQARIAAYRVRGNVLFHSYKSGG
ncbi:MAG: ABC transporter substrate-binding protein [Planctomycetota bacterium]|jgi:tungstate transport system substrate-binding protein